MRPSLYTPQMPAKLVQLLETLIFIGAPAMLVHSLPAFWSVLGEAGGPSTIFFLETFAGDRQVGLLSLPPPPSSSTFLLPFPSGEPMRDIDPDVRGR